MTEELKPVKRDRSRTRASMCTISGRISRGFVRLKVKARPGRPSDTATPSGSIPMARIYTENLRRAKATDIYICKGKGVETYQPTFTFHGFQYVEVKGLPYKPDKDTVTALAFQLGRRWPEFRVFRQTHQPPLQEHHVGTTRQFHLHTHRLPAA